MHNSTKKEHSIRNTCPKLHPKIYLPSYLHYRDITNSLNSITDTQPPPDNGELIKPSTKVKTGGKIASGEEKKRVHRRNVLFIISTRMQMNWSIRNFMAQNHSTENNSRAIWWGVVLISTPGRSSVIQSIWWKKFRAAGLGDLGLSLSMFGGSLTRVFYFIYI